MTDISGNTIILGSGWQQSGFTTSDYLQGMVEWEDANGQRQVRTIRRINNDTDLLTSGDLSTLSVGDTIKVIRGCDHTMTGCNKHGNILNFGGQWLIPPRNPYKNVSIFY